MRRAGLVWLLLWAAGCTGAGTGAKGAEEGMPEGGKGDAAGGLIEHESSLQEIGEIGVHLTDQIRGHAWRFQLGTREHVSIFTARYSGTPGAAEVDTVLYLYAAEGDGWGHAIARNDDAADETTFSRIEMDLAPGSYRIVAKGYSGSVRGEFAVNLRCADGFCDYYDPDEQPDPEEPGVGTADQPGQGAVSFRVPLLDEGVAEPISRFNSALAAAGLPTFPDYVTASSESESPSAEFEHYQELSQRDDVLAIIGESVMAYLDPSDLLGPASASAGLCHEGDPTAVVDFMSGFADGIFSDQFGVWGWRAGSKSAYNEWHEPTPSSNIYDEWQAFDPSSDDVMIVYSTDDEGTEHTEIIPRCEGAVTN